MTMDWANWQTYATLAIVLGTLGVFVRRCLKMWLVGSDKTSCGSGCGCDVSTQKKKPGGKLAG